MLCCPFLVDSIFILQTTYSKPSRTDMYWSKVDTCKLLQVAESFPEIWQESHTHFQSIQHRMTAYSAINYQLAISDLSEVELMKKFFWITAVIVKRLNKGEDVDSIVESFPNGRYLVEHQLELQENRKKAAVSTHISKNNFFFCKSDTNGFTFRFRSSNLKQKKFY
jgi:hypothetical protein